jgi:hypothetical protein
MLSQGSCSCVPCCAGTSAVPGMRPRAGYGSSEGPAQVCENQPGPGIAPPQFSLNNPDTRGLPFHPSDTAKLLAGHHRLVAGRLVQLAG